MDFNDLLSFPGTNITVSNHLSTIDERVVVKTIIDGLTARPKYIPSMFFYDAVGSKLFEEITRLPEYYAARMEKELIKNCAHFLQERLRNIDIVELGSGDCSKISLLLDEIDCTAMSSVLYKPLDVSLSALKESAILLVDRFPKLNIHCIVADFISQFSMIKKDRKQLLCFFGSTIGNLTSRDRRKFLTMIGQSMQSDDMFLLGIDMVKSKEILERAYNDNNKITARFNRNILSVVNTIARTNFKMESFEHMAFFNEKYSRIEMHLKALENMVVWSSDPYFEIKIHKGESIHTENSYKFTINQISELTNIAGLQINSLFMDPMKWFSLLLLTKKI
jgi:L-histidine Nalpha-methyltransferase